MITSVLGAPGSGKSTITPALAELLPDHVVLDWDAFMEPAAALAGREIRQHPQTWPAYRELVGAVVAQVARLPVVLLGVCTPDELQGWSIGAWVLLDCADQERRRRLRGQLVPERIEEAVLDGEEYRSLGLPVIDTTKLRPTAAAAAVAQIVRRASHDPRGRL